MTLVPFTPNPSSPFSFTPTLGGQQFLCVVTWNPYGKRWYFNLFSLAGSWLLSVPMQPGSQAFPQNMIAGYASIFGDGELYYDAGTNQIVVGP